MHAPIATVRPRAACGSRGARAARLAMVRTAAATSIRAAPTRSGVAPARSASIVLTEPVVPHAIAARLTSSAPRTEAGLDGLDTARDHSPPQRFLRIQRGHDH